LPESYSATPEAAAIALKSSCCNIQGAINDSTSIRL
jgi:hypothetical protein